MSHMYLGFILGVTGSVGLLRVNFVFFAALPSFVEQDFYIFFTSDIQVFYKSKWRHRVKYAEWREKMS